MRYAIYFAPAMDTALAAMGAEWLGRDALTGERLQQPRVEGLSPDMVEAITADPRRYGFHATLKAPFRLADGRSETELLEAMADLARRHIRFDVHLKVARIDGFIALVPAKSAARLNEFAAACVMALDPFRAALSPTDLEKRRRSGLTPRQDQLLVEWGYPYVLEEFRFHMTLSERLSGEVADRFETAAAEAFADVLAEPVSIDSLALFVEPAPGVPFQIRATVPLSG
ncbi:DUF1045 domain-containing protein [Chthonobacter albigriseus]|uniref:DUF1045 domain-containing protein n=1 Tax=Chthonobacter albigriseus TaxID=1683161 RepID=UPI0015EE6EB7|nr:DUF1045 domain-containing protein [Chthonobacter albigriseus]